MEWHRFRDLPYEVSDDGLVRTLVTEWTDRRGRLYHKAPRVLRPSIRHGYPTVRLVVGPKRYRSFTVHEMVLEAFVGPRPVGLEACHWNGIKTDVRLANLRWDTTAANAADRQRHQTIPFGEHHWSARLTPESVREIRLLRAQGMSWRALSERVGMSEGAVHAVCARRTWAHVPPGEEANLPAPPRQYARPCGERNGSARLNNEAVKVIRFLGARGVSRTMLARVHGVGWPAIDKVIKGKTWTQKKQAWG